jgi:two-component system, LuxR family, sensor histidine kinase DctS
MTMAASWMARRRLLWAALVLLVLALLGTLVWLAGRYETDRAQAALERDAQDAAADIRAALTRNVQNLQALQDALPGPDWSAQATLLLREHRELVQLERRDMALAVLDAAHTAYRAPVFAAYARSNVQADLSAACSAATRSAAPSYSNSYFVPQSDGLGLELLDQCVPWFAQGRQLGFMVATYALTGVLSELVGKQLSRRQHVSLTTVDGARLAQHGAPVNAVRALVAQQLLDLPGNTLILRLGAERGVPDLFPNVLTGLVATMSLALVAVLVLLGRDTRRRLRAEADLADALAFRKAMEDSLVTGLRARDLSGRISYVNPAFCQMVGFAPQDLLGHGAPAPYWPPELVDEYQQRQAIRLAGNTPPREGFESVFMRKNGERFTVLIFEAPLINASGEQTGWMSAVLDVSEQRRMEEVSRTGQERLQASARLAAVGEMASLLSHELNQPLAAISSYATGSLNLLQAHSPNAEQDIRLAMHRIAEQAERAGQVIKSVHNFVRRRDQSRDAVSAQALLNAVMPLVALQARKLRITVHTEVQADVPRVLCDHSMVEQVLLNLARNGMQAMDGTKFSERVLHIEVRSAANGTGAEPLQPAVRFSVSDQGPGISPEVAQQLFTPFFTTKAEGMGLGLSLCRTVIEQHGGHLSYASRAAGGTVFSFTLPIEPTEPIDAAP